MMRRRKNRKKEGRSFSFPAPLAAVLVVLSVVAISYLWLYSQCEAAGMRIKKLEEEKAELRKRVKNEEFKLTSMKAPRNLEALMKQHRLSMGWPQESQIVRLRLQPSPDSQKMAVRQEPARRNLVMVND